MGTSAEAGRPAAPHQVILQDRRALQIGGVSDVDSFNGEGIVACTSLGELTVRGRDLTVKRLSLETGDLELEGQIDSLTYSEEGPRRGKLRRLLR